MVGAGLATGAGIDVSALGTFFVYPLLLSPVVAVLTTVGIHPLFRAARRLLVGAPDVCVCVEPVETIAAVRADGGILVRGGYALTAGRVETCRAHGARALLTVRAPAVLDRLHLLSAGTVSFARGLNDTPKIAGLLAFGSAGLGPGGSCLLIAAVMATGGLLGARRVAETVSRRITDMSPGHGFSANLATSILVLAASAFGLPVSTTHVSVGAIFGIGLTGGRARVRAVLEILLAWIVTLPLAALLAALLFALLH